ncbi:MAG: ATP-binding cassette domain-containing protein [Herpetosiphon sp.]
MPAVELQDVSKRFGTTIAVDHVSFEVQPGEIFGLLGPNGAGKTTVIRMILDMLKPDHGTITVFDGAFTWHTQQRIGYLPEERGLYKTMTVLDCLAYLASLKGLRRSVARQRALGFLERVGLAEERHKKVNELSKGMQQKVQLGVALIHEPDLLIVDEPFYGLDPVNTRLVIDLLQEACRRGAAIMMSTHQMDRVEELCSRLAMFNKGQLVLYGPVNDVRLRFAPHAVLVEGDGPWETLPGVRRVAHAARGVTLWLEDDILAREMLRLLATRSEFTVERFAVATPSLDDIFVAVVQGKGRVEQADRLPPVAAVP